MDSATDNRELSKTIAEALSAATAHMLQGKSAVFEAKGIARGALDGFYTVAHSLYKNGQYADAVRMFRQLCFYDHNNLHYWLGLGYSQKMLKDYRGAFATLFFVLICLECDDKHAEICLHIAECCGFLGKRIEATQYAAEAMNSGNQLLQDRASVLLAAVSSH